MTGRLKLIDTHSHLHFPVYAADVAEVLVRMVDKKIGTITIGTTTANSQAAVSFADGQENVWAAVALHPEHLTSTFHDENEGEAPERELDLEKLEQVASSSKKVVAIGETGLDFHWIDEGLDRALAMQKQVDVFAAHVQLAQKLDLPLIIHCRDASSRLTEILKKMKQEGRPARGVVHSFSGSLDEAQTFLDLGMYLGINGVVTFKPRKADPPEKQLPWIVERLPLDKILLETDAPYLAPTPYRGQRNEPAYVAEVARKIADIKGLTLDEVAQVTTENAKKLFRI